MIFSAAAGLTEPPSQRRRPGAEDRRAESLVDVGEDRRHRPAERLEHALACSCSAIVSHAAQQAREPRAGARVDRIAVEVERRLDLEIAAAEADHAHAQLLELLGASNAARSSAASASASRSSAVGRLAEVPPAARRRGTARARRHAARRGEVLRVLEPDGGGAPVRDLPRDLDAQRCGVVSQTGTPAPS